MVFEFVKEILFKEATKWKCVRKVGPYQEDPQEISQNRQPYAVFSQEDSGGRR